MEWSESGRRRVEELLFGKATKKHCKLAYQNAYTSDMTSTTTIASDVITTSNTGSTTTSSVIPVNCSSLDVAEVKRFSRSVNGYSYTFRKWDPIYKFGNMPEPRMMHRFGMLIYLKKWTCFQFNGIPYSKFEFILCLL